MRRLPVVRRAALLVPLLLLASACGTKTSTSGLPKVPSIVLGPGGKTLYNGGDWAVVTRGSRVAVAQLVAGGWKIDTSGKVKITILGPKRTASTTPQVAAEFKAPAHLVETGLWIDGKELLEKGGGLTPTDVTIYGASDRKLAKGTHVAIAYGRTATSGAAVRWTFHVV